MATLRHITTSLAVVAVSLLSALPAAAQLIWYYADGEAEAAYDYLPYGALWSTSDTDYGNDFLFGGKERQTVLGLDLYDNAARLLSTDGSFTSIDPQASRYPHLNPYAYCASDPVNLIDVQGDTISTKALSAKDAESYNEKISFLKNNQMFRSYYERLTKSKQIYPIIVDNKLAGSGAFYPKSNKVIVKDMSDYYPLAQELFHAYQEDLNIYTAKDRSVREAEGDLVSALVMDNLNMGAPVAPWLTDLFSKIINIEDTQEKTKYLTSYDFINEFNTAAEARIDFYKNERIDSPITYIQSNSKMGPQAFLILLKSINIHTY